MFLCLWLGCLLVVEFVVLLVDCCGFACRVIYVAMCSVVVFAFCICVCLLGRWWYVLVLLAYGCLGCYVLLRGLGC